MNLPQEMRKSPTWIQTFFRQKERSFTSVLIFPKKEKKLHFYSDFPEEKRKEINFGSEFYPKQRKNVQVLFYIFPKKRKTSKSLLNFPEEEKNSILF